MGLNLIMGITKLIQVGEKKKAQEEIFTEQSGLLGEKLGLLFTEGR